MSEAGEDILEDEELIQTLDQSKQKSNAINERMVEAAETNVIINENRENYRPVATRGSILYFVIADLALVDPMYQYSLDFFNKAFAQRLEKSEKAEDINLRLEILIKDITQAFYKSICRGLFEKDKLLYSFLNTVNILRNAKKIDLDEWNFFLRGSPTDFSAIANPCDYISEEIWRSLLGTEECHLNFKDITKSFQDASKYTHFY